MSIPHAQAGQPVAVMPFAAALSGQKTVALFKSAQLEVMRLVLAAGKSMPLHKVAGETTIQCIEGAIDVQLNGGSTTLSAGHLLFLPSQVPHSLHAQQDSSALLTMVLCRAHSTP